MNLLKCDVAIIGGGCAGLMTAVGLIKSDRKLKIVIIEKNPKTGRKLMATGNGRCNLSNDNILDKFYFGTAKPYLKRIFDKYDCNYIRDYFEKIGLVTISDSEGRIYPVSNNVSSVLDCMRNYIISENVTEICNTIATDILFEKKRYIINCISKEDELSKISAEYVVISCGGKASPKLSTNGMGYSVLNKLNIKTSQLFPSLVAVSCKDKTLSVLKGIRIKGNASFIADGKIIDTQKGEIQFCDNTLSGICILQLSRYVNEYFTYGTVSGKAVKNIKISLDIMPQYSNEECKSMITQRAGNFGKYELEKFFDGLLHKKTALAIWRKCNINDLTRKTALLTKKEISIICRTLKNWEFVPYGISSFENAQITAGGVIADEINFGSMESRKYKNLYINGEVVDIDGICGGYNLHWAWSSGIITSESICKKIAENKNGKTNKIK